MGSICNGSWGTTVQHAREYLPFRHGNTSVFQGLKQTSPSNPPRSPSWREMQLKMDTEIVSTSLHNSVWCDPWLGTCYDQGKGSWRRNRPCPTWYHSAGRGNCSEGWQNFPDSRSPPRTPAWSWSSHTWLQRDRRSNSVLCHYAHKNAVFHTLSNLDNKQIL